MFQTHLNYFSSLLPIKFVGFLKKKGKKSIICSCRCAYIHTGTNKKGDAFVSNPQGRQYPKILSKKQNICPCRKAGSINSPCGTDSNKRPYAILFGGWV